MYSYEELEPKASLHNAIFKICESHVHVREMLRASSVDVMNILIESFLGFCEMSRLCGDHNDLLLALAKTGFLEQKFENSERFSDVYTAVLAERAEILWSRREPSEAVQSLRSLLAPPQVRAPSFTLISEEIVYAKLVTSLQSSREKC